MGSAGQPGQSACTWYFERAAGAKREKVALQGVLCLVLESYFHSCLSEVLCSESFFITAYRQRHRT